MTYVVTLKDIRKFRYCSKGARDFFKRHDLDWSDFLKNGIDAKTLEKTGDTMAIKVTEYVKNGRK